VFYGSYCFDEEFVGTHVKVVGAVGSAVVVDPGGLLEQSRRLISFGLERKRVALDDVRHLVEILFFILDKCVQILVGFCVVELEVHYLIDDFSGQFLELLLQIIFS
jgi:hypothetical protein